MGYHTKQRVDFENIYDITKYIMLVFSQVDTACASFVSKVFLDLCAYSVLVREGKLSTNAALGKLIYGFQYRLEIMMAVLFKRIGSLGPDLAVGDRWQEGHTYKMKVFSDLSQSLVS